eukprot:357930-Chlamydomonas_euryale.AAC.8
MSSTDTGDYSFRLESPAYAVNWRDEEEGMGCAILTTKRHRRRYMQVMVDWQLDDDALHVQWFMFNGKRAPDRHMHSQGC